MIIIKNSKAFCTSKIKIDAVAELTEKVTRMDEYQARLVLSFVKSLFGSEPRPGATAYGEEQDRLAS